MLDYKILTISNVERPLAFYEAALRTSWHQVLPAAKAIESVLRGAIPAREELSRCPSL